LKVRSFGGIGGEAPDQGHTEHICVANRGLYVSLHSKSTRTTFIFYLILFLQKII